MIVTWLVRFRIGVAFLDPGHRDVVAAQTFAMDRFDEIAFARFESDRVGPVFAFDAAVVGAGGAPGGGDPSAHAVPLRLGSDQFLVGLGLIGAEPDFSRIVRGDEEDIFGGRFGSQPTPKAIAVIVPHISGRRRSVIRSGREFEILEEPDFRGVVWESSIGLRSSDGVGRGLVEENVCPQVSINRLLLSV